MSNVSDFFSNVYNFAIRNNAPAMIARGLDKIGLKNGVADFIEDESRKSDLRGTEITSFLNGLPIVGGIVRGIEGINQLEDLYDRTGKTVEYPTQTAGASGLGHALSGITRKIEDGSHDLGEYYAGESLPVPSSTDQLMHGWNQRNYHIRKW